MEQKFCPVCQRTDWNYDVVDAITGFRFCGDCYKMTEDVFEEFVLQGEREVSGWLKAIPETYRRNKDKLEKQETIET